MTDSTYNGWTNYATWRINLEMFDGDNEMYTNSGPDVFQEIVEETIESTTGEGIARDYAMAFINDVNWYEIAEHFKSDDDA